MNKNKTQKGLALIEVMIGVIVVAVIGAGIVVSIPNYTGAHKRVAEDEARTFAKELDMPLKNVSCTRQDTDGDSYISCTFKMEDDTTEQYECTGAWTWNSGCREPKFNLKRNRSN
jgi:Tfp pilus assembly protein PilE